MSEREEPLHISWATGGDGPLRVLFAHATGFCKEVWLPTISYLNRPDMGWSAMDMRGHGDSEAGELPHHWDVLVDDILSGVGGATGVVGVGHSAGGGLLTRAALTRPGTFRHLVAIEPIILPLPVMRTESPISQMSRRRRRSFPSRDAALERFSAEPFTQWDQAVRIAYIDHGFHETDDGWELKCAPELEADFYLEGLNHDTWDRLPDLDVPVTLVVGEHSDTHRDPYLSELAGRFPDAELVVLEGVGHLVPMEVPDVVARIVGDVLP